ncbi:esterase [Mucilaginibacter sp. Bleaf8]|uniref:alpha/beta hydrolase family esterase n=1 Tax=Mucilaginibacter sp. Bleaf8 TaxID=2834430 RepID=UPI001BCC7721|nr:esterase [Mucilaginibacter sp. Bleaf8]MBS7562925.1 esterase [Mucilaginibacter sp. Bleaf8]
MAQTNSVAQIRHWKVGDTTREAMVYLPGTAKTQLTPVIFVFHGHGGNMQEMLSQHEFEKLWPESIIIVPQGLNTPGKIVDLKGRLTGWQQGAGDQQDRDLHFFDVMLADLQEQYKIDRNRIFATGHSNGGSFVYLLWATRGELLAAVAPSAAAGTQSVGQLTPKPVLQIIGTQDPLVKPGWQMMTVRRLQQLNECQITGQPYGDWATFYSSAVGAPVVVYQHPGGHTYPREADAVVVRFFKSIKRP